MRKTVGRTYLEVNIMSSNCEFVFGLVRFEIWASKWGCLVDSLTYEFSIQGRHTRRRYKFGCPQYTDDT